MRKTELGYLLIVSITVAHFVIALGRTESFISLLAHSYYWLDLAFVAPISFVVIGMLYVTHRTLDGIHPLFNNIRKRLLLQVAFVVVAPALIALLLAWSYQRLILGYEFLQTSFIQYEYPVAILIIIISNLLLFVITLLRFRFSFQEQRQTSIATKDVVLVSHGNRKVPVYTTDIAAIYKDGELPVVFTFSGKQFVLHETLDNVLPTLDPRFFFRANRQAIVHLKLCESYAVHRSGKIDLQLRSPLSREISVSQKRARDFKTWVTQS